MTSPLIHMMHFPWDDRHVLLADENAFDHAPVEAMRQYAPDFDVRLWTLSKVRDLCQRHYPAVWAGLENVSRPVMRVDVLRWVVVHRFGGIYWQMNATPLRPMAAYLPLPGKGVRLFTEFILSPEKCNAMAAEPIRNGQPEESTRVLVGAFSSRPAEPFVANAIDFLMNRVKTHVPKKDYDILYVTGNAAISAAYDQFGKSDPAVELVGLAESRQMLKCHYRGSWRREAPAAPPPPPHRPSPAPRLDRMPLLGAALYRRARHPHETMLARRDADHPRASFLRCAAPILERLGIRTVFEAPCGAAPPIPPGIAYVGGDPNRDVVAANRKQAPPGARFRHVNLLYSRFPQVDLFICPDFLEWLPYAEVLRVLRRIAAAKPKYLALTSCPLLAESWDSALGDYRPINGSLSPFLFPIPDAQSDPAHGQQGRSDCRLMAWRHASLPRL